MDALFYASLTKKTLSSEPGGSPFQFAPLTLGDVGRFRLRLTESIGRSEIEVAKTIVEIKVALGARDKRPTGGDFTLVVDGEETAGLSCDVAAAGAAAAMETALNALSNVGAGQDYGAASVSVVSGSWEIVFAGATEAVPLEAGINALVPSSGIQITAYDRGDGVWIHEVRLRQMPVALTSALTYVEPVLPAMMVTEEGDNALVDGYTEDGTKVNEIQGVLYDPSYRGSFAFVRNGKQTIPLIIQNNPAQTQAALNASLADEGGAFLVRIGRNRVAHIEFTGSMGGIDQDLLEIVAVDAPPNDPAVVFSLGGREAHTLLRQNGSEALVLEFQVRYKDKASDGSDKIRKATFAVDVTLQGEIITDDLSSIAPVPYGAPYLSKKYIPFDPTQVQAGILNYPFVFGDTEETAVPHGLDTEAVFVMIRENESGGARLIEGVDFRIDLDDSSQLTVVLLGDWAASLPGATALAGVVLGAEQESFFNDHTHPMSSITGLVAYLAALSGRVDLLEDFVPVGAVAATTAADIVVSGAFLPVLASPTPNGVAFLQGADALVPLAEWWKLGFPEERLGLTFGRLLPAVHDASVENLPTTLPAASSDYAGSRVFVATADNATFPGGGIKAGDHAACTGLRWYRVAKDDAAKSTFYPALYELELFDIAVTPDDLTLASILALKIGFEAAVFAQAGDDIARRLSRPRDRRTEVICSLVLESGIAVADTTPGTPDRNLDSVTWSRLLISDLTLTAQPQNVLLDYTLTRAIVDEVDTLTAAKTINRRTLAATAPASIPCRIRGKLTKWDTRDTAGDPAGLILVRGLNVSHDGTSDPARGGWSFRKV
jgi:hypothetical protein